MMNGDDIREVKLYYTTHHNWSWVVTDALRLISLKYNHHSFKNNNDDNTVVTIHKCDKFSDLPSILSSTPLLPSSSELKVSTTKSPSSICNSTVNNDKVKKIIKKEKKSYALFRIDVMIKNRAGIKYTQKIRTRSDVFGFLDPKDSLYHVLSRLKNDNNDNNNLSYDCMPLTILIPWNYYSCYDYTDIDDDSSTSFKLHRQQLDLFKQHQDHAISLQVSSSSSSSQSSSSASSYSSSLSFSSTI
jgi:hypothetical protein